MNEAGPHSELKRLTERSNAPNYKAMFLAVLIELSVSHPIWANSLALSLKAHG